jgi:hypothetical protein
MIRLLLILSLMLVTISCDKEIHEADRGIPNTVVSR